MDKVAQILVLQTPEPHLRSVVEGRTQEDPNLFKYGQPIGYTPLPNNREWYDTVLAALSDGWEMIGPPVEVHEDDLPTMYDWWLRRL